MNERAQRSAPAEGLAESERGPDLKAYLAAIRRRLWAVLTVFVVVTALGTLYAFRATPVYRGEARILIEKQSQPLATFEGVMELQTFGREHYKTQEELAASRAVLEMAAAAPEVAEIPEIAGTEVDAQVGWISRAKQTVLAALGTPPPRPLEPWERLCRVLAVEHQRDTHLLVVAAENTSPDRAAKMANAVAHAFEALHLERRQNSSNKAFIFLKEQKAEQEQKVIEAENSLQSFREAAEGVFLDLAEEGNPELIRLSRLSEELTEVQLRRAKLEAHMKVLADTDASHPSGVRSDSPLLIALTDAYPDPTIGSLRAELVAMEEQVAGLSDTYGAAHPQLRSATARLELLRQRVAEGVAELRASLAMQLETIREQERGLVAGRSRQNEVSLDISKQALAYNRLKNEVARQRKLFDVLVERMREVDVTGDFAGTNVEVVEEASVPRQPIRPRKMRTAVLSVALGLLLGMGLALLLDHMDETINTPEDLEESIGVRVLGFVPQMAGHRSRREFPNRGAVSALDPHGQVAEAYRNIRTNLTFSPSVGEARVIAVTSGSPGEGKTTTASNLALAMAQDGHRVLLIDGDLHRPMLHEVFQTNGSPGLTGVLSGGARLADAAETALLNSHPQANLEVLTAGHGTPDHADGLDSKALLALLTEARDGYDWVIVDTPPVLFSSDASILGAMSDGVIMVAKAGVNRRSLASRACRHLADVDAHLIGCILNQVRPSRLGYSYSGYYHYGYSKSHGGYYAKNSRS